MRGGYLGYSCTLVFVFAAGDFSTNARNDKGVRCRAGAGGEPVRASELARVRCRRSPSGRLPRYGYAFARNDKAVRVYAWLAAGRGRPALPKRKTTFQTNTCHRWLPDGRTRASSPTYPIECKYGRSLLARAGSAHIAALAQKKRSERFCRSDRFS